MRNGLKYTNAVEKCLFCTSTPLPKLHFGTSRYFTLQVTTEGEGTLERTTNFCTKRKRHFDTELNPAKNIFLLKAVGLHKNNPVREHEW